MSLYVYSFLTAKGQECEAALDQSTDKNRAAPNVKYSLAAPQAVSLGL